MSPHKCAQVASGLHCAQAHKSGAVGERGEMLSGDEAGICLIAGTVPIV